MTVRRVSFPANSGNNASQRVYFPIYDDAIDEEPEGFIIVLYRDDNLTSIEVAFTPNLRTTLGRINDDDRELYHSTLSSLPHFLSLSFSQLSSLGLFSMRLPMMRHVMRDYRRSDTVQPLGTELRNSSRFLSI